jgi:hypothetical protein
MAQPAALITTLSPSTTATQTCHNSVANLHIIPLNDDNSAHCFSFSSLPASAEPLVVPAA